VGAALNVSLVFAGGMKAGMIGAAVGTSLSYVLVFGMFAGLFVRHMHKQGIGLGALLIMQPSDMPLLKTSMGKFWKK